MKYSVNYVVDLNDPTYVVAAQHFRQLFYRYGSPNKLNNTFVFYFNTFFLFSSGS
jgi:hypothetical protein